ncbi:MCE family protein [Tsukamurella paurometabola]|uniref:Virulence factor Mce family protein n=1 Tax=Tsukamurella paurometabola (strain ATCC 8368 / DSM 20162 / CCUG 35730 / CIP 100753 / JCM 10117 / KCTC 9821 / NBRC 16120 / NCIMB 702349 / NCTC 13040) TaxID=521096 RepID=D5UQ84_TSUPD|nr:MCE family protein [Tsukamurella paurometabola]ADG78854.1 virulence factor Mce family protein [Tsukamurella paurometabola DSM 20162]SUP33334.1 virulence factor Mce family protein [Tsukamurella paurometabola]
MGLNPTRVAILVVMLVAVVVLAGAGWWLVRSAGATRITAYFDRGVGIYAGSDVRILGVKVGEIDEVSPERDRVRVQLHVDRGVQLPQDLWAAQVTPSVISDRYVQLLPVYSDGPTAQSGAVVAEDHTMTPVEIDQVYASVSTLAQALGPEGANKRGALTEVLDVSSQNLAGNGQAMADAIAGLSKAATTLSDSRDNIAATVKGLNTFVTMLAENDKQVRVFNTQLADLTGYLAGERDDFTKALNLLASALGDVGAFVRDNRDALTSNVNGLTEITKILNDTRTAQAQILSYLPIAASNLQQAYDGDTGTLTLRPNLPDLQDPFGAVCKMADLGKLMPGNPQFEQLSKTLGPLLSQCTGLAKQITDGVRVPQLNLPFGILSGLNLQQGPVPGTVPGRTSPSVDGVLPKTPAGTRPAPSSSPAPASAPSTPKPSSSASTAPASSTATTGGAR